MIDWYSTAQNTLYFSLQLLTVMSYIYIIYTSKPNAKLLIRDKPSPNIRQKNHVFVFWCYFVFITLKFLMINDMFNFLKTPLSLHKLYFRQTIFWVCRIFLSSYWFLYHFKTDKKINRSMINYHNFFFHKLFLKRQNFLICTNKAPSTSCCCWFLKM